MSTYPRPRFGDMFKWTETKYTVMYIGPGTGHEDGWTGLVLIDDAGNPLAEPTIGKDWMEQGVTKPVGTGDGGWIRAIKV